MNARRCLALWVKLPPNIACRRNALREGLARMSEEAMIRANRRLEPSVRAILHSPSRRMPGPDAVHDGSGRLGQDALNTS